MASCMQCAPHARSSSARPTGTPCGPTSWCSPSRRPPNGPRPGQTGSPSARPPPSTNPTPTSQAAPPKPRRDHRLVHSFQRRTRCPHDPPLTAGNSSTAVPVPAQWAPQCSGQCPIQPVEAGTLVEVPVVQGGVHGPVWGVRMLQGLLGSLACLPPALAGGPTQGSSWRNLHFVMGMAGGGSTCPCSLCIKITEHWTPGWVSTVARGEPLSVYCTFLGAPMAWPPPIYKPTTLL
mmetsp:Transcript_52197/g.93117  ORF Transcript_52197/g.93117 Transcript_52197/m.93117 type:complete len:234 (+) Transcript_52197:2920-3621(+)